MQAAGMLRDTRAICRYVLLLAPLIASSTYSYPLQFLPDIPGYIPVYIRNGDQPLQEINPALAEAFHETSSLSKSIRPDHSSATRDSFDYDKINSVIDSEEKIYPKLTKHHEKSKLDKQQKRTESRDGDIAEYHSEETSHVAERKVPETKEKVTLISKESIIKLVPITLVRKELPSKLDHHGDSSQDFVSVINVEALTDSPNVVRLYKDVEHSPGKQKVDTENEGKKTPIKTKRPTGILSNIQKFPPIDLPKAERNGTKESQESSTRNKIDKIDVLSTEVPAIHYYKDLSQLLDQQNSSEFSAKDETPSVKKLLPTHLLNETEMIKVVELPNEKRAILYKDLSRLADNQDSSTNSTEKEVPEENAEPPLKVASFADLASNVYKVLPETQRKTEQNSRDSDENRNDNLSA